MVSKSPDIISIRPHGVPVEITRRSARATSPSAPVPTLRPYATQYASRLTGR